MEKGTVVSRGNKRRVQVRKARPDAFSEGKKQVFLDHYAATCNVTRAAAVAGVSVNTVNYHRRNDPVFSQQMAEALGIAYDGLDEMLVERAKRGGHYVPGPDAEAAPRPETMDTELALHLLRLRRAPLGRRTGRAGYEPKRASEKELDDAICAKLELLGRRVKAKGKSSPSTSSGRTEDKGQPKPTAR